MFDYHFRDLYIRTCTYILVYIVYIDTYIHIIYKSFDENFTQLDDNYPSHCFFIVVISQTYFNIIFIGIFKREYEKEEPLVAEESTSESKSTENKFAKIVKSRLECTTLGDITDRMRVVVGSVDGGCILVFLDYQRIEQLGLQVYSFCSLF